MKTLKAEDLVQFTGTETWWRHPLKKDILYTDGAKYVADAGEAYWLLDVIVSVQTLPRMKRQEFQVWILKVNGNTGVVTAEDGNGKVIYRQELEFTDFPLPEIKFYFTDGVILLPSEY